MAWHICILVEHVDRILEARWLYFGSMRWLYFGNTLDVFWDHIGCILGACVNLGDMIFYMIFGHVLDWSYVL